MKLYTVLIAALGLASSSLAQVAKQCASQSPDLCFSVSVPDVSAASGNGDLYFQIQGPESMSWIGLGQGSQMQGANMFVIYASDGGQNVTLSPRLGTGHVMPRHDDAAMLSLLEGSGLEGGMMRANVRCSNCARWQGGEMDFTSSNTDWIWAARSGPAVNSDDVNANIMKHDMMDEFVLDLTKARGGSSLNPFLEAGTATTSAAGSSSTGSSSEGQQQSSGSSGGSMSATRRMRHRALIAHGVLMALAMVVFYPIGAVIIRLLHLKSTVWVHASVQLFAYCLVLAGLGLGVYVTGNEDYNLNFYHPIIGLTVIGCLLIQPFLGLIHHRLFKQRQQHTFWADIHTWFGRLVLTLGIINGGLGLRWAGNTTGGEIAYGVVAGVVWVAWMTVAIMNDVKRTKSGYGAGRSPRSGSGSPLGEKSTTGSGSVELDERTV